jgi:DNA (cytosine-5)-methyltransferase 1
MTLTAVDCFSGAGGLSLGLTRAGFDVRLSFDNDQVAVDTHRKCLPGRAEVLEATSLTGETILELAGLDAGQIDLLAGGPPCQGFSLQRRGARTDPRNQLVLRYLDWITDIEPRAFLIENVVAIGGVRGQEVVAAVAEHAEALGYTVQSAVLDANDYGVPQVRRRVFIVGIRDAAAMKWPAKRRGTRGTVRDAFRGLPSPPPDGSPHPEIANHYRESKLSVLNLERIRHIPEGGGRESLPPHLVLNCHRGSHRHLDTYGRLAWDAPAVTITARFDSFTRGRFGHPVEDRSITLREGARLQSFPDEFVFLGNREDGARLIGNAVPPRLAHAIGRQLALALGTGTCSSKIVRRRSEST